MVGGAHVMAELVQETKRFVCASLHACYSLPLPPSREHREQKMRRTNTSLSLTAIVYRQMGRDKPGCFGCYTPVGPGG